MVPLMYQDIWTAAKGMYKLEPVVADGGELVLYAPHIKDFSETHGDLLAEIGYHTPGLLHRPVGAVRPLPRRRAGAQHPPARWRLVGRRDR